MSFADLGLIPELLQAVTDAGYTEPTPIQRQAIPIVIAGKDVMGGAQTGTGKTAGFTLPLLHRIARHANSSTSTTTAKRSRPSSRSSAEGGREAQH